MYQALYDRLSHQPNTPFTGASLAEIDLIGTIAISLMTIGAPFATAWTKRFSPRAVVMAGGVLFAAGGLLASVSQKLWQFELTQGVLLGLGICLTYMPAVTVAPTWFTARRGLAMGIVLAGTGVGGVLWAPVLRALNEKIGFRNTLRVSSCVSFTLILTAGSVLTWEPNTKQRIQTENAAMSGRRNLFQVPLVDWRVAKTKKFVAQALGASLQSAAYYTPVFFFASYAKTLGYSESTGANFIALSNAANATGKVAIGYFADRYGRLNSLLLTTAISAVTVLGLWLPSTRSEGGENAGRGLFVAFTILYGIFASAYVSLFPTALVESFGIAQFPSVNGSLYLVRGLATLIGTPLAGVLVRSSMETASPRTYQNTSLFAGVLLAGATCSVLWVRIEAAVGGGWKWKA